MARILKGVAVAAVSFVLLGSVATLWENPVFVRMTPAGNLEIVLLGAMSVLLGAYAAVRRPACSIRTAGTGGVLGFLAVATGAFAAHGLKKAFISRVWGTTGGSSLGIGLVHAAHQRGVAVDQIGKVAEHSA